jgi:hypothetical protein
MPGLNTGGLSPCLGREYGDPARFC